MLRPMSLTKLARHCSQLRLFGTRALSQYSRSTGPPIRRQNNADVVETLDSQAGNHSHCNLPERDFGALPRPQIGETISRKDKIQFLVSTLLDIDDSKEAVYSALDAWVAWERIFPIGSLKNVLLTLQKEQQWHKIIQVIKWMLSKGQGNTMGTYKQLIQALDMDHRAKEAHEFWMKKIGYEFHSVPWDLCTLMISVYYRNNMFEDVVKLFKGLEAFDRKPPEKSIVRKVADAYEILGSLEEKERILAKYKELFSEDLKVLPARKKKHVKKKKSQNTTLMAAKSQ